MERVEVELYDRPGNAGVIRLPGRRFPGVFIQGDSLSILVTDARRLAAAIRDSPDVHELAEDADELARQLTALLDHYTATLAAHDIPLPYNPDLS